MVNLSSSRILVVEDERDGQQVLADILTFYKMMCDTVSTAEEGLKHLKTRHYDAAIIDLGLPGMNGFDLLTSIRTETENNHMPCIAYTAYHTSKVRYEALNSGFDAYLQKPVGQETLINTLRRLVVSTKQTPTYNDLAEEYARWIDEQLSLPYSVLNIARSALIDAIGDVSNLDVCDLGCGEGHLTRTFAPIARSIVGVDFSGKLLEIARSKSVETKPGEFTFTEPKTRPPTYVQDDAQQLSGLGNSSFDLVFSNLVLTDIPDLSATLKAVARVLSNGGRFIFSITHPCFQSPGTEVIKDKDGQFASRQIMRYANEGRWISGEETGIRGKLGAHHRTLSTYFNTLISTGFTIQQILEPTLLPGEYEAAHVQAQVEIPAVMVIATQK